MKKIILTLLCSMMCAHVFSQIPTGCYVPLPQWQELDDLEYKVQNSKFLPKDKKDELFILFTKLKIVNNEFYYGTNDLCKEVIKYNIQVLLSNKDIADVEAEWDRYTAAGCEGEVSESQYASCLEWNNTLSESTGRVNKRNEALKSWETTLLERSQLLITEATNNNNAFIKDVEKALKSVAYYEFLVDKYGSLENVRQKHLPSKSDLKKFLLGFYFEEDGAVIPIKGDSKLHTNRNKYNMATSKFVIVEEMAEWYEPWLGYDFGFHGGKADFRGKGKYAGCQAVYNKDGSLDDNTKNMGTFDYAYFYCGSVSIMCLSKHNKWDISPHKENGNYESGLTTTF